MGQQVINISKINKIIKKLIIFPFLYWIIKLKLIDPKANDLTMTRRLNGRTG